MRFATLAVVAASIISLQSTTAAEAAECFDSGETFVCSVQMETDGSFAASSPERGEVTFLVDPATGEAERLNYDQENDRSWRAGYYRALSNPPGCWQNVEFDTDIFCAFP